MARGTWLLIVFVVLAAVTIGFWWNRTSDPEAIRITWEIASAPPLIMGVIPYLPEQLLKREFHALTGYLSKNLHREVQLNFAVDYESLGRLLDLGKVQLAWFSANSFESLNRENRWESICRPLREGAVRHRGAIVVREGSGIRTLAELRGRRFAYVDRHSGTGFVMPNQLFRAEGIDPLRFFSEVTFTGNHSTSISGVLSGAYDAAAVYDVYSGHALWALDLKTQKTIPVPVSSESPVVMEASHTRLVPGSGFAHEGLFCIAFTEWLLNDPVAVRRDMDATFKEQIRDLLVNMKKYPGGSEVLQELSQLRKWNGFIDERSLAETIASQDWALGRPQSLATETASSVTPLRER
ncbi:MAG TPA: phosphate/phosphite/phosphonate ABC transporter substrate-binding protein [Candidatus Ozemobacteraceae bacterium]|nr:phosphate/phosphite/phosphonate ABC transporter substrate-binding protein [Candidatus Ozemobacteraceae bacterium]